jgi:tetratricopeptide (TPR) repeat protein
MTTSRLLQLYRYALLLCLAVWVLRCPARETPKILIEQPNEVVDYWDSVVEQTMPLLHRYPQQPRLLAVLADAYTAIGIPDSALWYWERVIAIDSPNDTACYRAATLYIAQELIDSAASRASSAHRLKPTQARYAYLLAQIYMHQDKWAEAQTLSTQLISSQPNIADLQLLAAAIASHEHDYAAALSHYSAAIQLDNTSKDALTGRATIYIATARYREALADLTAAGTDTLLDAQVQNHIGICQYQLGDYQGAIAHFKKAITLYDDQQAGSFYNRGIAYLASQVYDSAAIDLHTADVLWQEHQPSDSAHTASLEAVYYLAQCYRRTGDIRTAYTLLLKIQQQGYKEDISRELQLMHYTIWIADYWYYLVVIAILAIILIWMLRKLLR